MKSQTVGLNEMVETDVIHHSRVQKVLLTCGFLSSLLYFVTTLLGAMRWQGYDSISQSVSELSAIGAPSRPLVIPLFILYNFMVIAFAVGVWRCAGEKRSLRVMAALLVGYAIAGLYAGQFGSMHMRGVEATQSDTMHIILTIWTVLSIFLVIGFGAAAFGKWFRIYSIATILVLLIFGAMAGMDGSRVAANLPTPWLGLTERINIFGFLLWLMVLSIVLLHAPSESSDTAPTV